MADKIFEKIMVEEMEKKKAATAAVREALRLAEEDEAAFVQKLAMCTNTAQNDTKATGASCGGKRAPLQKKEPGWKNFLQPSTPDAWKADVEAWFQEHAAGRFEFLNTNGLTKKTVQMMARFRMDTLTLVMTVCKGGGRGLANNKVSSMDSFDDRLYSKLFNRHENGCYEPWEYNDCR
jgi:hypothetical protein